jgi:hypothetical protein
MRNTISKMNLKRTSRFRARECLFVASLVIVSGCGKPANPSAQGKNVTKAGAVAAAHGLVVDGEHFTTRTVRDAQQGGLPVLIFAAPEKWRDSSQVVWNYEYNANPVSMAASVEDPDSPEAYYAYPGVRCFSLRPDSNYYRPGQNVGGLIHARQIPPAQALLSFVQRARGGFPRFQVVGSKDLPGLPAALSVPAGPNQHGIGLKVTYELKGQPVEEEFYSVAYSVDIPYDGPQGRTWQNNWGLDYLHSFRARQGTLDKRRPVFAAIPKSVRINPAWRERRDAVVAYLAEEFNRQLKAGYDQIAAAGRLSRQISANNDAMVSSIDRQLQASRASAPRSQGRSASDKFDDYVRGVDTVDDAYYGTSQHSYNEQYHWTDGYGSYRNSNEPGYNPNQQENGNWQLMQPAR